MDSDIKRQLIKDICILISDIETCLKVLKLVPNQISQNGPFFFSDDDEKFLLEAAKRLDSNQFKTNVGLTIGSSLGIVGGALGIAGLSVGTAGIAGVLLGVGLGISILGGTSNMVSTASRNEVQKSCAGNISPALQKFCAIPHILQGTIYCYGPFIEGLQGGERDISAHLDDLDLDELKKVQRIAVKIKSSLRDNNYQSTLENLFYVSEAAKKLVGIVFRGRENWLDPQDEKQVLEVIAAVANFAIKNDIKSLNHLTKSMAIVRISGCVVLGLCAKYSKAATMSISTSTESIANISKAATAMKVASITLHAAGMIIDAATLAGTVKNLLDKSPSELSETLRDIAKTIKHFREIRDF